MASHPKHARTARDDLTRGSRSSRLGCPNLRSGSTVYRAPVGLDANRSKPHVSLSVRWLVQLEIRLACARARVDLRRQEVANGEEYGLGWGRCWAEEGPSVP